MTARPDQQLTSQVEIRESLGCRSEDLKDPQDVIDAVIAFANGDTRPHWKQWSPPADKKALNQRVTRARRKLTEAIATGIKENIVTARRQLTEAQSELRNGECWAPSPSDGRWVPMSEKQARILVEDLIDLDRQYAIEVLEKAVAGRSILIGELEDWVRRKRELVITMVPIVRVAGSDARIEWQLRGPEMGASNWVILAAGLIAGRAQDNQTGIGRCQLETCQRFFVLPKGERGKPRVKYCKPECRLERHARSASERQRRHRSKKAGKRTLK